MGLQLSTNSQAPAQTYENSPPQGYNDIELPNVSGTIYDSLQRGDRDEHTYGVAGVPASENAGTVLKSSEVTLSRSVIVLVVSGMILISMVISIISGVVVYHVTNGKITRMVQEEKQNTSDLTSRDYHVGIDQRLEALNKVVQTVQEKQTTADMASCYYLSKMDRRLETLGKEVQAVQEKQNTSAQQVAFVLHTPRGTLEDGRTPIFGRIVLNDGNAYNTTTGMFTCPIQGVYLFTVTLKGIGGDASDNYLYCDIFLNKRSKTRAYCQRGGSASMTTFMHLYVGDVVHLRCTNLENSSRSSYSLYSGALVKAD